MNEITALIEFSPTNLGKFFDSSIDDIEEDVPLFGLLKNGESTLYLLGDKNTLDQDQIDEMIEKESEDPELPIGFKVTKFKYNLEIGSNDSLAFHKALLNTKADNVF